VRVVGDEAVPHWEDENDVIAGVVAGRIRGKAGQHTEISGDGSAGRRS
jgi:hypothetical protein